MPGPSSAMVSRAALPCSHDLHANGTIGRGFIRVAQEIPHDLTQLVGVRVDDDRLVGLELDVGVAESAIVL